MTTTEPAAQTAPKKTVQAGTDYVILQFSDEIDMWAEHGDRIRAASTSAAIRKHVQQNHLDGGSFIAIPARSFKAVAVKTQTVTTLKLESA